MNTERILALADLIEKQPNTSLEDDHGFCMENFTHECGTPACVAGWALAMQNDEYGSMLDSIIERKRTHSLSDLASAFLEIDDVTAASLFYGDLTATQKQAAATLRRLAASGKVDWEAE